MSQQVQLLPRLKILFYTLLRVSFSPVFRIRPMSCVSPLYRPPNSHTNRPLPASVSFFPDSLRSDLESGERSDLSPSGSRHPRYSLCCNSQEHQNRVGEAS